jgi:hypothetical protein
VKGVSGNVGLVLRIRLMRRKERVHEEDQSGLKEGRRKKETVTTYGASLAGSTTSTGVGGFSYRAETGETRSGKRRVSI